MVEEQIISLPHPSIVLTAITQQDMIMVYVLVEPPVTETHDVKFRIVETGDTLDDSAEWWYLATVTTGNERYAWHVFAEV